MATIGGGGYRAVPYPGDVERVEANLARFSRNVPVSMKTVGATWARALAAALDRAAAHAPAPQTRRFVGAAEGESDATGAVVVVSAAGAGFFNDSAVLNATEHGSDLRAFHAPRGGRYWIDPTMKASEPVAVTAARQTTTVLVNRCNAGG